MTDDPLIGRQLGNFRLERVLGRGGMAQVYYGWDVKLERPVAVKVVDARFRSDPSYAQRFVREAQSAAKWRHENIAQVYYADEEDGLSYFAMEYIDGSDLGQLLSKYTEADSLMPQSDVVRVGRAVASALDYAHEQKVIHRDVKPSNVMIAGDDRVVLTDFGLALDVEQGSMGQVFGTAHYIAPEQAKRSADAVPQSDLYSLGIMLYEMLTGTVPFDDPSPTAVALQHITQPPPAPHTLNPELSSEVEAVLLKALSKSPQERYQTGGELMMFLENALNGTNELDLAPLPPLPAEVSAPEQPVPSSKTTVVATIAAQAPSFQAPQAKLSSNTAPPSKRQGSRSRNPLILWLVLGVFSLIAVVFVILVGFVFATPLNNFLQGVIQPVHTATTSPLEAPAVLPSNTLPAAAQPAETLLNGTSTVVSNESLPTNISPTNTPLPVAAEPTVKYPNGKHFELFYNDNSFYLLNLSDNTIPINWVAFERLGDDGTPMNRFNGSLWAQFYPDSLPDRCVALEIFGSSPYLDPTVCGHNNFLSLRTPTRDASEIFWTSVDGSHQFRALWREGGQDEEVGRCEISAGTCEVFFP